MRPLARNWRNWFSPVRVLPNNQATRKSRCQPGPRPNQKLRLRRNKGQELLFQVHVITFMIDKTPSTLKSIIQIDSSYYFSNGLFFQCVRGQRTSILLISLTISSTLRKDRGSTQYFHSSNLFTKPYEKPISKLLTKDHHIKIPQSRAKLPYPLSHETQTTTKTT